MRYSLEGIRWGTDNVIESLEVLPKPIDQLSVSEIRGSLRSLFIESSLIEDELDLPWYLEGYCGLESPRSEQAKRAEKRRAELSEPDSILNQLIKEFHVRASSKRDLRLAEVQFLDLVMNGVKADPEQRRLRNVTGDIYKNRRLDLPGRPTYIEAKDTFNSSRDSGERTRILKASCQCEEIRKAIEPQTENLKGLSRKAGFKDFNHLSWVYNEAPEGLDLEQVADRLLAVLIPMRDALFLEITGRRKFKAVDYYAIVDDCNPFSSFNLSEDPWVILEDTIDLFSWLGYDRKLLVHMLDTKRPGVFIDIEARKGKKAGIATFQLSALAHDLTMLFANPGGFRAQPLRKGIAHEAGHVADAYLKREAVGENIEFFDSPYSASEVVSKMQEQLATSSHFLKMKYGVGNKLTDKIGLFEDILYFCKDISGALVEYSLHSQGPDVAGETFLRMAELTKNVGEDPVQLHPSGFLESSQFYTTQGIMLGYLLGNLYVRALQGALGEDLYSHHLGEMMIGKIIVGNEKPMAQRINEATGVTDLVGCAIDGFNRRYQELN